MLGLIEREESVKANLEHSCNHLCQERGEKIKSIEKKWELSAYPEGLSSEQVCFISTLFFVLFDLLFVQCRESKSDDETLFFEALSGQRCHTGVYWILWLQMRTKGRSVVAQLGRMLISIPSCLATQFIGSFIYWSMCKVPWVKYKWDKPESLTGNSGVCV